MSEGAEQLAIFTCLEVIWIRLTEFGLVLFWMVELLDPIMRTFAVVAQWALEVHRGIGDVRAHDRGVEGQRPAPILEEVMIVQASLRVVRRRLTLLH